MILSYFVFKHFIRNSNYIVLVIYKYYVVVENSISCAILSCMQSARRFLRSRGVGTCSRRDEVSPENDGINGPA